MAVADDDGLLLGRQTPPQVDYAPHILHPIPRQHARDSLGLSPALPFYGVDLWHAYEMSWLDPAGKPLARVGRFSVPASSPNIVESKSFKLYLNSLNSVRFASQAQASATITADLSAIAGAPVTLDLLQVEDPSLAGASLTGQCVDDLAITTVPTHPDVEQLVVRAGPAVEETLYSHLLRSLCPVTGQPDWASVWIHYRGKPLDHSAVLRYLLAYREHQEFHEQCVERMFRDLCVRCEPETLQVQAFYTRRGGLDINPFRSTDPNAQALPRLNRQ